MKKVWRFVFSFVFILFVSFYHFTVFCFFFAFENCVPVVYFRLHSCFPELQKSVPGAYSICLVRSVVKWICGLTYNSFGSVYCVCLIANFFLFFPSFFKCLVVQGATFAAFSGPTMNPTAMLRAKNA